MSPHRTRPDSPVETPEEPQDPCQHWRGTLRFRPQLQKTTSAPTTTGEETQVFPHNSCGDLTFLRQQERVPEVPVITGEEIQVSCRNSRKTRRDESLFCCGVSREIPPSFLRLEMFLDVLDATQEALRHILLPRE